MNANLVIHIGPPKTATTSLQCILQDLDDSCLFYGGIFQPRSHQKRTIGTDLYSHCNSSNLNQINIKSVKEQISFLLNNNDNVFISEEQFLCVTKESHFLQKLKNLYKITEEFNPTIVFFIRNIEDVLPSYYQELWNSPYRKLRTDFVSFEKSEDVKCYHYEYFKNIKSIGFQKINFLYFDKFIKGKYSLRDLMGISSNVIHDLKLIPEKKNRGKLTEADRVLIGESNLEKYIKTLSKILPDYIKGKFLRKLGQKKIKANLKVSQESIEKYQKDLVFANFSEHNN